MNLRGLTFALPAEPVQPYPSFLVVISRSVLVADPSARRFESFLQLGVTLLDAGIDATPFVSCRTSLSAAGC